MTTTLLLLALFAADPTPQQTELLKTFREEFIAITPGEGKFPKTKTNEPFSIAKYEVPQNLWEAVLGNNPSRWKGKRNSVEMFTIAEAAEFCAKATELMRAAKLIEPSQVVRLPSEAEWEYCTRAGTTTKYSFGDDASKLGEYGWSTENAAGNDPPVGAKKPNPWGLYDVHGYLWEFCSGGVIRGGSWKDKAELLTSDSRKQVEADLKDDAVGLRCVLSSSASGKRQLPDGATLPKAVALVSPAQFTPTAQAEIVPAGSKLELLWGEGEFTEGPALAPDGSILFSDIGTTIFRYDPSTGKTEVFRKPSGRSNGLMFDAAGRLIACEGANTGGNRRISITEGIVGGKDGTIRTLAERYNDNRFNSPNDLAIDSKGNVYFTDPRYVGNDPRDLDFETIFFVTTDGKVQVATRDIQKPNGILVSADGKTVYAADNNPRGNRHLVAFSIQSDGLLAEKKILWDFGQGRGIDGMTLDTAGNIYATAGTGDKAGIYVFSPTGKHLAYLPTPGDPTNCCFGGAGDASTLYITSANSKESGTKYGLFRVKLNATGHHVVKLTAPSK